MKNKTYIQIINNFIKQIERGKTSKTQMKLAEKNFKILSTRLINNNEKFMRRKHPEFLYTIKTIEKNLKAYIMKEKGTDTIKKRLKYIVKAARIYNKSLVNSKSRVNLIKRSDDDSKFRYILSPAAETHCSVCAPRHNKIYKKDEALKIQSRLPEHYGCRCRLEKIK